MTRVTLLRLFLLAAAVPALLRVAWKPRPHFVVDPPSASADGTPFYASEYLPRLQTPLVHGATLAELPNGDLAAAWYGGSDEVSSDVVIFFSRLDHTSGRWSTPRLIEDPQQTRRELRLHVKSIGNPVLYADARGLRLFYVAIIAGGWSGGTVCVKSSPDGVQWTPAQHVVTSAFFNVGMLVRSAPAAYDDGTLALPIYHELARKWSAVARVDVEGRVVGETCIEDPRPLIQPWLAVTGPDQAAMVMRYGSHMQPLSVTLATSVDAGANWSDVDATPLVHRDSAVAVTRLGDGSLLVFYNNTAWDRRDLSAARTPDGGAHWSWPHPFERDTTPDWKVRREYSYPYVIRTRDGRTHLLYTWQRTQIRHIVFNDSWVKSDPKLAVTR